MDFRILEWISGFQNGFLDFKVGFWISDWISGFQSGFLPTVYEISFVADPSEMTQLTRKLPIALRLILRGSPGPTA